MEWSLPPCEQENTPEVIMCLFFNWQIFIMHTDRFYTVCCVFWLYLFSVFLPSLTIPIVFIPLLSDFSLLLLFPLYSYTSLCVSFFPPWLFPFMSPDCCHSAPLSYVQVWFYISLENLEFISPIKHVLFVFLSLTLGTSFGSGESILKLDNDGCTTLWI